MFKLPSDVSVLMGYISSEKDGREKSRPIKCLFRVQANKVKSDCNWTKPHNLFFKGLGRCLSTLFEGWRLFQMISALVKAAHFQMKVVGIIAARLGRRLP